MQSDVEIVRSIHQRVNDCLLVQAWWRANEVRDAYSLVEGDQWLTDAYTRQNSDGMPIRTVNKLAIVLDAISGFEIQNRSEVQYIPRKITKEQENFSDMLNEAVKYIETESQSDFQISQAFKDMLICGVGVTDTYISYDQNPDGEVVVERVFPYLMLWDVAARAKNLEDADWVVRAKIVDKDAMGGYIKDAIDQDEVDANFGAAIDARFLDFFNTVMIAKSLGIIYEYQWREKKPFYRVENTLKDFVGDPEDPYVQSVVALAQYIQEKYEIDITTENVFSIESQDHATLKEMFDALGIPFNATKQKKYKYYRAIVIGNKVIEKSENFSQTSFSIKFMTGKFSETRQCYYGVVRAAKEPQRLLNQTVSDYEGFLRTIPKGGVEIEADAVPNMEAFVQTYTKAREVTIYNPGGLSKTRPKLAPPMPSGLLEMINFAAAAIMETTGVNQDFMGVADSKNMTATLNRQLVRQGLTVLSPYFDAKKFYVIGQGRIFIDCVKTMVENSEGRLIRVVDNGKSKYFPLLKNNIAATYDIVIEDVPQTPNERQDTFEKLLQMASMLANKPNPIDIMPMVVQYSPLKTDQIEEITNLMQPPPPPQPDPIAQNLLVAETKLKESTAEKNIAEAMKMKLDTLLQKQKMSGEDMQTNAQIEKILADANLAAAKAASELTKI